MEISSLPVLRPYQINVVDRVVKEFNSDLGRVLVSLPPGAGKTSIYAGLIAVLQPSTSLLLVTSNELVNQTRGELAKFGIFNTLVCTIQKIIRGPKMSVDLLIIDEAHHSIAPTHSDSLNPQPFQWSHIFGKITSSMVVGGTGTAFRTDHAPFMASRGGFFDSVIESVSIEDLQSHGWAARLRYDTVPLKERSELYKIHWYNLVIDNIVRTYYEPEDKSNDVINIYTKYFMGIQSIAFCQSINHAQQVASEFCTSGIPSEALHYLLPYIQRRSTISKFKNNGIKVLTTCNIASEGLDLPSAKLCIMLRKIKVSANLLCQQIGRVIRPYENQEAIVLDLVGNIYRLGTLEKVLKKPIK